MKRSFVVLAVLSIASSAFGAPRFVRRDTSSPLPAPSTASPALALASLDRQLADLEVEEKDTKKELGSIGPQLAEAHARSLARGRAFYRLTRAGMLPVGGGFDELVTHALRVERARRALATEIAAEQKLRVHGAELSRTLERIARDRVSLAGQRTSMDQARSAAEDETRRQQAFEKAFSTSSGAGTNEYVAIYGGNGMSPSSASGFSSAKGRLLFPLAGRSEVRPARREGTDGPGLEIRSAIGSPVRAVYAGRVAFADRYGPYGRLVIVDHGDHYFSVSGNLASVEVKVGDEVSAGERIGAVGDEGRGPMLYFEIRHGTETVTPMPWLGI
jgi:murein DD-endopeptidase MepM/ murein hydrolase activator NlpD